METLKINLTQHPIDTSTLLNQMFDAWDEEPNRTVILLTHAGAGKALVARIRVKLSSLRVKIRVNAQSLHEFQLNTYNMPWTELDGTTLDSVFVTKRQSRKHVMLEVFDSVIKKG